MHNLGDMLAFGFITGLMDIDDQPVEEKIVAVRQLIESNPEKIDLSIKLEGARKGMWSVSEPQIVVLIEKL